MATKHIRGAFESFGNILLLRGPCEDRARLLLAHHENVDELLAKARHDAIAYCENLGSDCLWSNEVFVGVYEYYVMELI